MILFLQTTAEQLNDTLLFLDLPDIVLGFLIIIMCVICYILIELSIKREK